MIVVANCLCAPRELGAWIEQMFGLVPSTVNDVPGFRELHLRKVGPEEINCIYVDLTIWDDRSCFENWRGSEAFEMAHMQAKREGEKFRSLHPLRYVFDIEGSLDIELLDGLLLEKLSTVYSTGISSHSWFSEVLAIVPNSEAVG